MPRGNIRRKSKKSGYVFGRVYALFDVKNIEYLNIFTSTKPDVFKNTSRCTYIILEEKYYPSEEALLSRKQEYRTKLSELGEWVMSQNEKKVLVLDDIIRWLQNNV